MQRDMFHVSVYAILLSLFFGIVQGEMKTVDLTHNFDNQTIYWPSFQQYKFKLQDAGSSVEFKYVAYRFCTAEHGGTHLDAPVHFSGGTQATHEVPLERLIGTVFIVDVSKEVENNRDLFITVDHLKNAEKLHDMTMDNKVVLLYTGYSHHWPNAKKYLGTATTNTTLLHFPGLHPEAAKWIVANRKVKSIGIDTASMDQGQSTTFTSHRVLFKVNIPVFENVNLKSIDTFRSKDDTMIYALPMKIKGGSGAPLRIIATYDNSGKSGFSFKSNSNFTLMLMCMVFVNRFIM